MMANDERTDVESLPGLWSLSPLGALLGVLVILIWMLATGRLYTRHSHDEIMSLYKDSRDEWKRTAQTTLSQNADLLETTKIVNDFFHKTPLRHVEIEEADSVRP